MQVGTHDINGRVLIVAEVGNNHEGDMAVARDLVEAAAEAGADAVKFQTFRTEHYVSASDAKRFAQLQRFQLSPDNFEELAGLARRMGLLFLSTPFDLGSLQVLLPIVDAVKIASGDNDFFPLLTSAAESPLPLIVSTGASGLEQVRAAVAAVESVRPAGDTRGFALLHAVSSYPTPAEQANVRAVAVLAEEFGYPVGYSDHTIGNDAAVLSVALGARIIEKHFTLQDVQSDFRDHVLSADPQQMQDLVARVRAAEECLGMHRKEVMPAETDTAPAIRRSIAAGDALPAGHVLRTEDLTWVRPGTGLRPGQEHLLVGRTLTRDVHQGDLLTLECLQ